MEVQEALKSWLRRTDQPFMALLGDYGTGKTTSCRLLNRNLGKDDSILCYFFNLQIFVQGYKKGGEKDAKGLHPESRPGLEEIIAAILRHHEENPDDAGAFIKEIRENLKNNRAVVIFDGLDEVLVYLNPDAGKEFIHHLLSIVPWNPNYPDKPKEPAFLGKRLVSCRTHFFSTLEDQAQSLHKLERENVRPEDWGSLLLLPFEEWQIREYFSRNFPEKDADDSIRTIRNIHDLEGLATRPYLLGLIAKRIEELEEDRMAGKTVNTASLYDKFVKSWLTRDSGKHRILKGHKPLIMEALAQELWLKPEQAQSFEKMAYWFEDFVIGNRVLANRYSDPGSAETFLEDLRTATFIRRGENDGFAFVHRSIHEYFLARRLLFAMAKGEDGPWRIPSLSRETLDFAADLWQIRPEEAQAAAGHCEDWLGEFQPERSKNLLTFYLAAGRRGMALPHARGLDMGHLDLSELSIEGSAEKSFDLTGLRLKDGRMSLGEFKYVDFSRASIEASGLTRNIFNRCNFSRGVFRGVNLQASTFRYCHTGSCEFTDSPRKHCRVIEKKIPLPLAKENAQLEDKLGHSGKINSAVFSPNSRLALTASEDGRAILWDVQSGKPLRRYYHLPKGNSAAFDYPTKQFTHASEDAWRWFAWHVREEDGGIRRVPAEYFGEMGN